jgi:micrococcal nuclease
LLLLLTACTEPQTNVKVTGVIDGDTIIIEGGYRVRYIGIDTPEKDQAYYEKAKQINRELVHNKTVRLERDTTDKDRYGRLLRYVYVEDIFVNAEIVKRGYAYSMTYPPDTKYQVYLEAMEQEARLTRRGMWK